MEEQEVSEMEEEGGQVVYLFQEDENLVVLDPNSVELEEEGHESDSVQMEVDQIGTSQPLPSKSSSLSSGTKLRNVGQTVCYVCGKSFGRTSSMKQHMKIHNDRKEFKCYANNCETMSKTAPVFKGHFDAVHKLPTSKKYQEGHEYNLSRARETANNYYDQQQQPSTSSSSTTTTTNNNNGTASGTKYPCRKGCDKSFGNYGSRHYHEKRHSEFRPFACEHCDYRAHYSQKMMNHYKSQHKTTVYDKRNCLQTEPLVVNNPTFNCQHCHQSFKFEYQLTRHLKTHDPFTYSICSKTFLCTTSLKDYEVVHSRERNYKCTFVSEESREQCPAAFTHRLLLKTHIETVYLGVKYICDICHRSLSSRSSLNAHRKRHDPFISTNCSTCGRTFYSKKSYTTHFRVHRKKPCGKTVEANNHTRVGMRKLSSQENVRIERLRKKCREITKRKRMDNQETRIPNRVRILVWPCNDENEIQTENGVAVSSVCSKLAFCWTTLPIEQMRIAAIHTDMLRLTGCISINNHHLDFEHNMDVEAANFILTCENKTVVRAIKRLLTEFVPGEHLTHVAKLFPLFQFEDSVFREIARIIGTFYLSLETDQEIYDRIVHRMNIRVPRYQKFCRDLPKIYFDGIFSFRPPVPPPRHSTRRLAFNMDLFL